MRRCCFRATAKRGRKPATTRTPPSAPRSRKSSSHVRQGKFSTDFITNPPRSGGGTGGSEGGEGGDEDSSAVPVIGGQHIIINSEGRLIPVNRNGQVTKIPVDEYRREVIARVTHEAHNLGDFRALWIEAKKRRQLIDHLLGDNLSPKTIREVDQMKDFDLFDFFGKYGYHARALKRLVFDQKTQNDREAIPNMFPE